MIGSNNLEFPYVGIFFYIDNVYQMFLYNLHDAEKYGDFLVSPDSHMEVWNEVLLKRYHVDFDYFPRGRIVYNIPKNTFYIYYDKCIGESINEIKKNYERTGQNVVLDYDEHYQCHRCNPFYVV